MNQDLTATTQKRLAVAHIASVPIFLLALVFARFVEDPFAFRFALIATFLVVQAFLIRARITIEGGEVGYTETPSLESVDIGPAGFSSGCCFLVRERLRSER